MKSKNTSASIDPYSYSITVCRVKVGDEQLFKGTVAELPDVATFEETPEAAYLLAIETIESLYESSLEDGRSFPNARSQAEPLEYSGRLTLRMPRWLHALLGGQANTEGISLNQYLISILSSAGSINALISNASERIASNYFVKDAQTYRLIGGVPHGLWIPYVAAPNVEDTFIYSTEDSDLKKISETRAVSAATVIQIKPNHSIQ